MNSTLLPWDEVTDSGERLIAALDEERKANDLSADNPKDATILKRWRTARGKVERAAEHYVSALENYQEAVLSELAHGKAGGPPAPSASATGKLQEGGSRAGVSPNKQAAKRMHHPRARNGE